ncbi:MAG TPA: carboxypeptidase-like regulatory domain-containing protein [Thermoanaerobaculia bacterium]|nr:carboxypeptidase-like regulatory domain-containing protein [Thermoanaerobaculia bacterium]
MAGAFVWPESDPAVFVRTDARGAYTVLPGRGPHRQSLQAVSPEHVPVSEEVQGPAAPAFVLHPASVVSGAVVEAGGRPVPGAALQFLPRRDHGGVTFGWHRVPSAHSDSQGLFRLRLPAGASYDVKARHPDFASASAEILALEPRTARKDVRIVLGRGHAAFGRVVNAREQPVAGATVRLEPVPDATDLRRISWRERDGSGFEATTDTAGRFEIRRLPAGRFDLEARAQGYPPVVVRGLPLEGGAAVDLGTVILPPGVTVEGTVVDSTGKPVAGADVQVLPLDALPGRLLHSSRDEVPKSGLDGRFTITGLREGQRVELQGWKQGHVAQPTVVEVPPPGPVRLVLTPAVRITGRVVREDGKPISGAWVYFFREGSGSGIPTDDQGRFEMRKGPGEIDIRATADGYLPKEMRIEAAAGQEVEDLRIVLRKGAVVTGRVLGPDGAPVPGAEVRALLAPSGNRFHSLAAPEVKADGEGRYRLEGIPEGRRSIAASHPELQRAVKDLDVRPGENRLDLQLGQGFPVTGRVVDAEGRPVEGARVVLSLAPGLGEFPRALKRRRAGWTGPSGSLPSSPAPTPSGQRRTGMCRPGRRSGCTWPERRSRAWSCGSPPAGSSAAGFSGSRSSASRGST